MDIFVDLVATRFQRSPSFFSKIAVILIQLAYLAGAQHLGRGFPKGQQEEDTPDGKLTDGTQKSQGDDFFRCSRCLFWVIFR